MDASHNSLTSYEPFKWYYKLFNFAARCQNKDIESQLIAGVRYFDIRLNKYKCTWYGAHGFIVYDISIDKIFDIFRTFTNNNKQPIYFRILMEDVFDKDTTLDKFKEEILEKYNWYKNDYMKLHLIGEKSNWANHQYFMDIPFYGKNDFTSDGKGINEKINEMNSIKERDDLSVYECYTYKGIPRLFGLPYPKMVADRINKYVKPSKNFTMIDFV